VCLLLPGNATEGPERLTPAAPAPVDAQVSEVGAKLDWTATGLAAVLLTMASVGAWFLEHRAGTVQVTNRGGADFPVATYYPANE
jgi:hypothetical protein